MLLHAVKRPACTDTQRGDVHELVLEGIITGLCVHGTRRLETARLRNVFCNIVGDLYQAVPGHKVRGQAMTEKRKEVCRILIQELGECGDSQVGTVFSVLIKRSYIELGDFQVITSYGGYLHV